MAINITFNTGIDSVVLTGTVIYSTNFWDERYGQQTLRTGDGNLVTYDNNGINVVEGEIVIKNVSYANGEELREWIHKRAKFRLNKFTIDVPVGVDLGEGKGNNLTNVYFNEDSTKGIFKYIAPGNYNIKFPFTYVRVLGFINGLININISCSGTLHDGV